MPTPKTRARTGIWLRGLAAVACCGALLGRANGAELVFIAPTNNTEPMARFTNGQLVGGLLKDIGDELSRRAGLEARYLSLPSKRVPDALRNGDADLLCYVLPGWIDGDFHWTAAFIPNAEVIAARPNAPDIQQLSQLNGKTVGTVLGYRYTHLLPPGASGLPFVREDAIDSRANLAKLAAGRMQYAVLDELAVRDYLRRYPKSGLRISLVVSRYSAHCAQSKRSHMDPARIQRVLDEMIKDGSVRRLLQSYGS